MTKLSFENEALALQLATAKCLPVEEAIRMALQDKMRAEGITVEPLRQQSSEAIAERRARTDQFVATLSAMPVRDPSSPLEIMGDLNALMIVVDSSALCAVLFKEPEHAAFQAIIDGEDRSQISAVNAHETAAVLRGRLGEAAVAQFWPWLSDSRLEVVPFDVVQTRSNLRRIWPLR